MKYKVVMVGIEVSAGKTPRYKHDHAVYVAAIPSGVVLSDLFDLDAAKESGVEFHKVGEFYYNSRGPRSLYARAIRDAMLLIDNLKNSENV